MRGRAAYYAPVPGTKIGSSMLHSPGLIAPNIVTASLGEERQVNTLTSLAEEVSAYSKSYGSHLRRERFRKEMVICIP